jgi:hypothetical protein
VALQATHAIGKTSCLVHQFMVENAIGTSQKKTSW